MNTSDEFYIGWESKAPQHQARYVRGVLLIAVTSLVLLAGLIAFLQTQIGRAVFEWNLAREFAGVWRGKPVPHLEILRPDGAASDYLLVAPWKHGIDPATVSAWDGRSVRLQGKLIYRAGRTMIEVMPDSIALSTNLPTPSLVPSVVPLGRQTLSGEIVDSKCHLGVMNPGQRTTHRACAVRCISGGIPPILLVLTETGVYEHYLLVGSDGRPLNRELLDWVAEPVRITGQVERQGEWLILKMEPSAIKRL